MGLSRYWGEWVVGKKGLCLPSDKKSLKALRTVLCWFFVFAAALLQAAPGLCRGGSAPASGKVDFVCDGDTIILESGERIRYLGIDAPEVNHDRVKADCFGESARKMNSDLVLHKRVLLQYDRERIDRYGRFLAYVILADGSCANLEMLRSGGACVFRTSHDFRRLEEFLSQQREAMHKRRGMWGECPVKPAGSYTGNRGSYTFHRPECALGKKIASRARISFVDRWAGLDQGYRPCRYCKP
jgi:micrococcal nuclease